MKEQRIEGMTRDLGKPENWDIATQGECSSLPVKDEVIDGVCYMCSEWKPTPADLRKLVAGGSLFLRIAGRVHPVVSLTVGDP